MIRWTPVEAIGPMIFSHLKNWLLASKTCLDVTMPHARIAVNGKPGDEKRLIEAEKKA
jgi:hypothetical protein